MREVNFSIPNVNKASVGITTALYDRRALDCTSSLPLINSLNHLAYLTTSSARIRDILTIDGGVERLVCICKEGRSPEMMGWKWNLAFQCIVNLGIRGSESVRTRIVEADVVPVIATILANYITIVEDCRDKVEVDHMGRTRNPHSLQANPGSRRNNQRRTFQHRRSASSDRGSSLRRHNPPPDIDIPIALVPSAVEQGSPRPESSDSTIRDRGEDLPRLSSPSPVNTLTRNRPEPSNNHNHHHHHQYHHHHHRSQDVRRPGSSSTMGGSRHASMQSLPAAMSLESHESAGHQAARELDRLPSILPPLQTGITSQPDSPTTPSAPSIQSILQPTPNTLRSPVRQQSTSGDSDDNNADEAASDVSIMNDSHDDPMVGVQNSIDGQESEDQDTILDDVSVAATLRNESEDQGTETFNITHPSANDGSIINANVAPNDNIIGFAPIAQAINGALPPRSSQLIGLNRFPVDRSAPPEVLAAVPRDEDVLMSLQVLAYVSKYCYLRSYFQRSHLVPKLKLKTNTEAPGDSFKMSMLSESEESDEDEEYLLPDDFNIFPLVEKFTVRHHSQDMQHWAGVVMRNLCRKDDARGGTRQCAYYECGRWEQYTRQFAKCRRCRRTKYCSKECQKNAWVFHRHWCQVATP